MHRIRRIGGLHTFRKTGMSKVAASWANRWEQYALFAVCCLALAVSMGVALVSLSKVLVLIAALGYLFLDIKYKKWPSWHEWPLTAGLIVLAFAWMSVTWLWSEAPLADAKSNLSKHSRLLWFIAIFYIIRTPTQATQVLKWHAGGLAFLLLGSWMLWLGLPVPWATAHSAPELGIVSASTLEQPVFLTMLMAYLWLFKSHWPQGRWRWVVPAVMLLTVVNVFFIMTGRTGFLVMFLMLTVCNFWSLPKRWKWAFGVLPVILGTLLFAVSPRFQNRSEAVVENIESYKQGSVQTSQAQRLDYWHRSLLAIQEKPILGHGVGSWTINYHRLGGLQVDAPSNPHQEYLLWAVEAGLIGLVLLLGIFITLYQSAMSLPTEPKRFMLVMLLIASVMSLMNCPLFGAAMGECFMLMWACLLKFQTEPSST